MSMLLPISPELEAKLRAQAAAAGKPAEELALAAIEDRFGGGVEEPEMLSSADWLTTFDAWVGGHVSRNPDFDDSRDGIYSDRD